MHTFFNGWRRKAGVVALVMACVLCSGWLRSNLRDRSKFINKDFVRLVSNQRAVETLISRDGVITWMRLDYPVAGESGETELMPLIWLGKPRPEITFRSEFMGFCREQFRTPDNTRIRRVMVPYWSLVLPLALLSAYLILWKPRR